MIARAQTAVPGTPTIALSRLCRDAVRRARLRWSSFAHDVDGPAALRLGKAVFRAVQRVLIAEAALLLTIALCALAGLPAIVTAFCAALVELVGSVVVAVLTFAPIARKLLRGTR